MTVLFFKGSFGVCLIKNQCPFIPFGIQEDWSVFLATKRRVMKLKMTEFDEEFNIAPTGDSGVSIMGHVYNHFADTVHFTSIEVFGI